MSGSVAAASPGRLAEILKTAPKARFWVSTALTGVNCRQCHEESELIAAGSPKAFKHEGVIIRCQLCAQQCVIEPGERGKCRARMNVDGELKSLVYGRPISIHVDPIEKKPFYHFLPGREAYSLATAGCPLSCKFCQNWELSQAAPEDFAAEFVPAARLVDNVKTTGAPIIAFTYNEPTVFTEYLLDIAKEAKQHNVRSVLISCGLMTEEPLKEMCETLAAIKIDLKGFSEDFYRTVTKAELKPVLRSIKQIADAKLHLEIVNLVVPTLNDSDAMLTQLADWVISEVGPDVPLHFTRFHPDYQLRNLPPTPIATLERARSIALTKGIHYAYVGNAPGHPGNHTYCPKCGKPVIKRSGFFVTEQNLTNGVCKYCDQPIAGVWA